MPKTLFVSVYLDQALKKPLDYQVPDEMKEKIKVGTRVEVPLRNSFVKATVSKLKTTGDIHKCRPISRILSEYEVLSPSLWKLSEWMAHYYSASPQKVLKSFIPAYLRKDVKQKTETEISLKCTQKNALEECQKMRVKAPQQAKILEFFLENSGQVLLKELLTMGFNRSASSALLNKGLLQSKAIEPKEDLLLGADFFQSPPKKLNEEQKKAVDSIEEALLKKEFSSHLIYGVTGSGKTEVYLQSISKALSLGKSVILLIPEISLTSQTIDRFRARFSEKIAILNHKRSDREKCQFWKEIQEGKIKIVVGARSAIFAPCQNLGLIIVDEEHDSSYKQTDEMPCYHGRDTAVMRAYFEKCPILLGSATPSIESRYNAEVGKYHLHTLKTRAKSAALPDVQIIDMGKAMERNGGFTHFSRELLNGIEERTKKGEQTLLLLNKRGYRRMQLCKKCKLSVKCPHCELALTFHKKEDLLKCHFCHHTQKEIKECPTCKTREFLEFKGFGTEHVERSLHAIYPDLRILRMDRDTTTKKDSHEELFKTFRSNKADVLIGTQMIAKGLHFPSVTLVGVLGVDSALNIPDFRSFETVFQLLTQVSGRAGRASLKGEVILQTFLPDHPIVKWAKNHDYDSFYKAALEERKMFDYPPFTHLIKVKCSDPEERKAEMMAENAYQYLKEKVPLGAHILPVSPSGLAKTQSKYHFHFAIKTQKMGSILNLLKPLQEKGIKIDVDPISIFF